MKKGVKAWLVIAEEDPKSAEYLFEVALYRMVCYHSQQAVENISRLFLRNWK